MHIGLGLGVDVGVISFPDQDRCERENLEKDQ